MTLHGVAHPTDLLAADNRAARRRDQQDAFGIGQIEGGGSGKEAWSQQLDNDHDALSDPKIALGAERCAYLCFLCVRFIAGESGAEREQQTNEEQSAFHLAPPFVS